MTSYDKTVVKLYVNYKERKDGKVKKSIRPDFYLGIERDGARVICHSDHWHDHPAGGNAARRFCWRDDLCDREGCGFFDGSRHRRGSGL